jgi:organic hydroperoxide reductase OsmC/OhrA
MYEHTISLEWSRNTPDFNYDSYSRNHVVSFGSVGKVCGSAAPEYHGDPKCLDPEQAFVMSLSSCHMLTLLAIASKKGFVIDKYTDAAIGELGKNQSGKMAMIKVTLQPIVVFSGDKIPSDEDFKSLHDRAHHGCIIANSIASCVEIIVNPTLTIAGGGK